MLTTVGILTLGAGVLLVFSSVKGLDPREVLRSVVTTGRAQ